MADYEIILLLIISIHCASAFKWKEFLFGRQGGSHSIIKGERSTNPPDSELYNQIILNTAQTPMKEVIGGEYCYPSKDTIDDNPPIMITRFEATDMIKKGQDSGIAFEESGGVGKNQVCIVIHSQWGGIYKYKFKVFGYPASQAVK